MYLWYGHNSFFLNYYYHTDIKACYTSVEIKNFPTAFRDYGVCLWYSDWTCAVWPTEFVQNFKKWVCQFYSSYNSFAIYKQNHIYLWYFCIMPTSVRPQLWFYIYLLRWLSNTDLKVHLQVFYFLISACSAASVALFADSSLIFSDIIAFTLPLYVS